MGKDYLGADQRKAAHKDDKEERISAIGEYIKAYNETYDVVILQELWMRPDHSTIKDSLSGTGQGVKK